MTSDAGVTPGLLTRNFTASDDLFDSKLQQVSWIDASWRDRKNKLMSRAEQLADLVRLQTCRPLGRPGTREWVLAFQTMRMLTASVASESKGV